MPIQGLTTRNQYNRNRAIPRLGKLRKGEEKQGNRPGKDLDYFRVDFEPQYEFLRDVFEGLYTKEPKEFKVKLIGNTVEQVFPTYYEEWNATTLLHQCDGEKQNIHYDTNDMKYSKNAISCLSPDKDTPKCGCGRIGRLTVMLPDLVDATQIMGAFTIETHSVHDIIQLFNSLMLLEEQLGKLMWLPVTIGRANQEKSYQQQNGKRGKKMYSLLYVRYDVDTIKDYMQPTLAPPPNNDSLQLPSGDIVINEYDDTPQLNPPISEHVVNLANSLVEKVGLDVTPESVNIALLSVGFEYPDNPTLEDKLEASAIVIASHYTDENGNIYLDECEAAANALFNNNVDLVSRVMDLIVG
jgi:hypothetical protein